MPDGRVGAPRGLHPLRLRRGGRDPRPRPRADGRRRRPRFVTSDHGFAPQWYAVNAEQGARRPRAAGAGAERRTAAGRERPGHHRRRATRWPRRAGPAAPRRSTSTWSTATRPAASRGPSRHYEAVRDQIVAAFQGLDRPGQPRPAAGRAARSSRRRSCATSTAPTALHPTRSGDVVVVLRPPYQFDAPTPGQLIAPSQFFGQHGYLPDLVDLEHNVNMHAHLHRRRPGHRPGRTRRRRPGHRRRPDDGLPARHPRAAERPRQDPLRHPAQGGDDLREITILDISDFHGQLMPLSEAADNLERRRGGNPTSPIGGAAFLKPWFDAYRAEARSGVDRRDRRRRGRRRTPPISALLRRHADDRDHEHDGLQRRRPGQPQLRPRRGVPGDELIPLAEFPMTSRPTSSTPNGQDAGRVVAVGDLRRRRRQGRPGRLLQRRHPEPDLPGPARPVPGDDPVAGRQRRGGAAARQGRRRVVAIGHVGADRRHPRPTRPGRSSTSPTA